MNGRDQIIKMHIDKSKRLSRELGEMKKIIEGKIAEMDEEIAKLENRDEPLNAIQHEIKMHYSGRNHAYHACLALLAQVDYQ